MLRDVFVALGDSITAGYGARHPNFTYVRQVSDFTREKGFAGRTFVIAQNGWTSYDILRAAVTLRQPMWQSTNVVTLLTGGNDLRKLLRRQYLSLSGAPITGQLVEERIHEFSQNMSELCALIQAQNIPHVLVANVYNPVPHYPLGVFAIERLNDTIHSLVTKHKFTLVDVQSAFNQRQSDLIDGYRMGRIEDLASPFRRPIHPNNAGHRAISTLFIEHLTPSVKCGRRRSKHV